MTTPTDDGDRPHFATFPTSEARFEDFPLAAEDVLEGDPRSRFAVHYRNSNGSVVVGVTRTAVGKYTFEQTVDEVNYVTAGRMVITSDHADGEITCTPGSVTRLDKGAVYTKTVLEPYEEIYVMLDGEPN